MQLQLSKAWAIAATLFCMVAITVSTNTLRQARAVAADAKATYAKAEQVRSNVSVTLSDAGQVLAGKQTLVADAKQALKSTKDAIEQAKAEAANLRASVDPDEVERAPAWLLIWQDGAEEADAAPAVTDALIRSKRAETKSDEALTAYGYLTIRVLTRDGFLEFTKTKSAKEALKELGAYSIAIPLKHLPGQ
jgi:hypothetical protein